jgi:hypothetical protein
MIECMPRNTAIPMINIDIIASLGSGRTRDAQSLPSQYAAE